MLYARFPMRQWRHTMSPTANPHSGTDVPKKPGVYLVVSHWDHEGADGGSASEKWDARR